jgi:hypothetical protein
MCKLLVNRFRPSLFYPAFIMIYLGCFSYGFSQCGMYAGGSINSFSAYPLYNPGSQNNRLSYLSHMGVQNVFSPRIGVFAELEAGFFKNADISQPTGSGLHTFGLAIGLLSNGGEWLYTSLQKIHLQLQGHVGYSFARVGGGKEITSPYLLTGLKMGFNVWYQWKPNLYVGYKPTLVQRISGDYMTYYQHAVGLLIEVKS